MPFIDDHVLVVDSPHDGLPLIDVSSGSPREIDRIHVQSAMAGGEPMVPGQVYLTNLEQALKGEITFGLNRSYVAFPEWGFSTTYLCVTNDLVVDLLLAS